MSMNKMSREQISALADNELADDHIDVALAALRQSEEHAAWDIYHQIGDVLRSDDMAIAMRPDFAARMAARLDAEPAIIAPSISQFSARPQQPEATRKETGTNGRFRRFAVPGAVAAAAASVALITAPQLMVAMKESTVRDSAPVMTASKEQPIVSKDRPVSRAAIISASAAPSPAATSAASSDGMVLRDPHIDEYLRAHQRFSPSMYSSAQFARSATLAHDSEK